MQLYAYLLQCLALLAVLAVAADLEAYQIASQYASERGVQLQENQQYAFYEYWYHAPNIQQCSPSGSFVHARLIVGQVILKNRRRDRDFVGSTYDLWKDGGILNNAFGGTTSSKKEEWKPGQFKTRSQRWQHVNADITYEYAGEVAHDVDANMIKRLG